MTAARFDFAVIAPEYRLHSGFCSDCILYSKKVKNETGKLELHDLIGRAV
jgi:hypothetical protein